ncbi:MAG: hypothetical protein KC503_39530 [Myxococcales bacterium]|nr:hypothetical protein [Myxococcales bacterium]
MKRLSRALLAGGFLGAAFFSVSERGFVDWRLYGACGALALIGLVLTHLSARGAARDSAQVSADVDVVRRGLGRLNAAIDTMWDGREAQDAHALHTRIDDELRDDLAEVAEARMALVARFGIERYADVMTRFAGAERYLNRAWSASVDGYVDEVWRSVEIARAQMQRAQSLLDASLAEVQP